MYKKLLFSLLTICLFLNWTDNPKLNTPVCTVEYEQKRPQIAPDGKAGAFIVWEDSRRGGEYDIYAQRIDASGKAKWNAHGIPVCTAGGPQRYPQIVSDGKSGLIVTWYDRRNGKNYDIYAQRIDASGNVLWDGDGVSICSLKEDQYDPILVPDREGGAFIAWYDRRNGTDYDVYAQRIDESGTVKWTLGGIPVCSAKGDQDHVRAVADGEGGFVVAWQDRRSGKDYDLYMQRINATGTLQWKADGIAICTAKQDQRGPKLSNENKGAVIVTWQDKRNGSDYDIYAQRIDNFGKVKWAADGIVICNAANSQYDPSLVSDGKGGAIITWQDYRKGSDCNFDAFEEQTDFNPRVCSEKQLHDWNIYAQKIDVGGKIQWAKNGILVCVAEVDQFRPQLVADGLGGAIIAWRVAEKENDRNIYAQRLTASGKVRWSVTGVAVAMAAGPQAEPNLISDGQGGAIIAWHDKRNSDNWDIYCQKVCIFGKLGRCL